VRRNKNTGSANKDTKLVNWLSGKSLKYCHLMSHFKTKMHQIRFLASVRLSVRSFVRPFVSQMEFDTYAAFRCWCTAPAAGTANDLLTGRRSAWQRLPACDEGRYPGVRRTHTEGRGAAGGGVMVARTMVGCALTRNQNILSGKLTVLSTSWCQSGWEFLATSRYLTVSRLPI